MSILKHSVLKIQQSIDGVMQLNVTICFHPNKSNAISCCFSQDLEQSLPREVLQLLSDRGVQWKCFGLDRATCATWHIKSTNGKRVINPKIIRSNETVNLCLLCTQLTFHFPSSYSHPLLSALLPLSQTGGFSCSKLILIPSSHCNTANSTVWSGSHPLNNFSSFFVPALMWF